MTRTLYTLRIKTGWSTAFAQVEADVSGHGHGVVLIRCADDIGAWAQAVYAGIEDAHFELYRRQLLPIRLEVLSFRATDETTEEAARLAACVAVIRAATGSKSWPKVIYEGDALRIVWGPSRRA